ADGARFLRDNYRDGVSFFRDPDSSSVPRSQLRRKHRVHGKRQETSRSGDALSLNDHGPVMQRGARTKDRGQEIIGDARIQRDAAFNVGAQANVTFYDD